LSREDLDQEVNSALITPTGYKYFDNRSDHLPTDGDVFETYKGKLIIATDLVDAQQALRTEESKQKEQHDNLYLNHSRIV